MQMSMVINLGDGWGLWHMLSSSLHGKGGAGAFGHGEKDHWVCIWLLLSEGSVGGLQFVSGSRGCNGTQEV